MTGRKARNGTLDGLAIGGTEMAALLGLHPGSLARLAAEEGLPRLSRGSYPVREAVQWFAARIRQQVIDRPGDLQDERRKLIVSQREGQNLANARTRAELLDSDLVATAMQEMLMRITGPLDDLPALAQKLSELRDPTAINRLLFDACRQVRTKAAADMVDFAASLDDGLN